jgi:hypothetical protein
MGAMKQKYTEQQYVQGVIPGLDEAGIFVAQENEPGPVVREEEYSVMLVNSMVPKQYNEYSATLRAAKLKGLWELLDVTTDMVLRQLIKDDIKGQLSWVDWYKKEVYE